ncbi:SRPBCC family protein [Sorangium sp. So ce1151]|uniref:SRPBCC family protein n=1 Tax=Sorangium sp. So ce1151 TaxID=3133332 RepID=UPI003F625C4A
MERARSPVRARSRTTSRCALATRLPGQNDARGPTLSLCRATLPRAAIRLDLPTRPRPRPRRWPPRTRGRHRRSRRVARSGTPPRTPRGRRRSRGSPCRARAARPGGAAGCRLKPPESIIDFVTDLHRYKLADWKIGRVLGMRREGDRIWMRHDGKLRGLPGPPVTLEMTILGRHAVRYRSLRSFPACLFLTFEGGFDLDETAMGTRVVHTERFRFFAPWRWVMDPFLSEWLARDVREEMGRLKTLIEAEQ